MDRIADRFAQSIEGSGFQRTKRTFARTGSDGTRHSAALELGRRSRHGTFTLILEISFPDLEKILGTRAAVSFYPLNPTHSDLNGDPLQLGEQLAWASTAGRGARFFSLLGSREDFLTAWSDNDLSGRTRAELKARFPVAEFAQFFDSGIMENAAATRVALDRLALQPNYVGDLMFNPTAPIIAAGLHVLFGRVDEATSILSEAYRWARQYHPAHSEYQKEIAQLLGLQIA